MFVKAQETFAEYQCSDFFPKKEACAKQMEEQMFTFDMDAANFTQDMNETDSDMSMNETSPMMNETRPMNHSMCGCDPAAAMHCVIEVQHLAMQTTPDWTRVCS